MKKGELVVKVLSGAGFKTATIEEVESIKNGVVRIVDSSLKWDDSYFSEIAPAVPGFSTKLIELDGGEEERIRKGFWSKKRRTD